MAVLISTAVMVTQLKKNEMFSDKPEDYFAYRSKELIIGKLIKASYRP
jgi:hypothetical protein